MKINLVPNEFFISKRIFKSDIQGKKDSSPIVRISVISISLAIVVNLITLAVVSGFQQEVRQKISGFGSHLFVRGQGDGSNYDSPPILKENPNIINLKNSPEIKSIYPVAFKPAILQSSKIERKVKLSKGKDTSFIQQDVQGVVFKGVDTSYNFSFFENYLTEGRVPNLSKSKSFSEILVSKKTATSLNYKVKDTINAFFVRNKPIKQQFIVSGIYNTELEEFDKKIVFTDLKTVQNLNDWGLNASINISDTVYNNQFILSADVSGSGRNFLYDWGNGFQKYNAFLFYPKSDTLIRLIVKEYDFNNQKNNLTDTAYLKVDISNKLPENYTIQTDDFDEIIKQYKDLKGLNYDVIVSDNQVIKFSHDDNKSNNENYISGFEIMIKDWGKLNESKLNIQKKIGFIPDNQGMILNVKSIVDNEKDLFLWLSFLDINVLIILILMLLIAIINVGSAMLVIIVVRTNFIGILKAIGARNWSIRKVFLYQVALLILRGMFWGNVIGLSLCFIQYQFGIFSLNPEVYYLNKVPIKLDFYHWLFLNLGTIIVCLISLYIPSYVVTKISPTKSIKFD
ncbi:MAG: hypothetical protein CL824_04085 [Crocinitomicaceae bacterium]|nr:hypothetical protein [Crocinitomicaceae bacterium]